MAKSTIRVLTVDDHFIFRQGIRALLVGVEDIITVGEASNGLEALAMARELLPDVILMDLLMPEMGGVETIRELKTQESDARVLILTGSSTEKETLEAVRAGALGYLSKECSREACVEAIRQVYRGEFSLPAAISQRLMQYIEPQESATDSLTPREIAVLELVARGFNDDEIAERLFVSKATVRTHISHMLTKLRLKNRVEAALYALRHGLATLDDNPDNVPPATL